MEDVQVMNFETYQKKPVKIEAVELTEDVHNSIVQLCAENRMQIKNQTIEAVWSIGGVPEFVIETLEGDMHAKIGDYLIIGVQGEIYSCKPDIFAETYQKV